MPANDKVDRHIHLRHFCTHIQFRQRREQQLEVDQCLHATGRRPVDYLLDEMRVDAQQSGALYAAMAPGIEASGGSAGC